MHPGSKTQKPITWLRWAARTVYLFFSPSSNFHSSDDKKMKMYSYSKLWGKIGNFPISCNQYFIFMPLLLFTLCFYPNWFCHNRITSYCSTASKYCASIKASRIFHVKSTRVQMIHSAIMLICYLWTTRRSLHRMSHRSNREACGESSALPDPHGLKGCFSFEEDFFFFFNGLHASYFRYGSIEQKHHVYCMVVSGFAYVCTRTLVWPACLCVQRKWLTVKNVTNSNFNCQWKNSLCICGFCPDEQRRRGLSMKAYSLSQLKSVLTYRHPFEVRLAAILERSAPVLNNGNWIGGKNDLTEPKVKFSLCCSSPPPWIWPHTIFW